jgi:Uma2 family endonuclease
MATMVLEKPRYPAPLMPRGREWTVDDLEPLPDDGLRYELIDGMLIVTRTAVPLHQRAARGIFCTLDRLCPPESEVFFAPLDFRPDRHTSLEPDVLVVRREDVGEKCIERPLQLAVEVLSPSTRRQDQVLKRGVYEDAGVASYWMFDPEVPSLLVCELADGRYVDVAKASGPEEIHVERPFPVRLCPTELAKG